MVNPILCALVRPSAPSSSVLCALYLRGEPFPEMNTPLSPTRSLKKKTGEGISRELLGLFNHTLMRSFILTLLLVTAFQAFAAAPVLKFTLTKADGTPAAYEFIVPSDDTTSGTTIAGSNAAEQQHSAGVAALAWAKQFYGAREVYLRSVDLQQEPSPYYLAKFDGEIAGTRQVFFAVVLPSGSVLVPVEAPPGTTP